MVPTADFSITKGPSGHSVTLASTSTDSDGSILKYNWNFGDSLINGTDASTVTHNYVKSGNYTVTLSVTDNDNSISLIKSKTVIFDDAPTASFTVTPNLLTANVDASLSTDDKGIAYYVWSWGDGTANSNLTRKTTSHVYTTAGEKTIVLTVYDSSLQTSTETKKVNVTAPPVNNAPTASFNYTISQLNVNVDASNSSDDGNIATYQWSWGDGK